MGNVKERGHEGNYDESPLGNFPCHGCSFGTVVVVADGSQRRALWLGNGVWRTVAGVFAPSVRSLASSSSYPDRIYGR